MSDKIVRNRLKNNFITKHSRVFNEINNPNSRHVYILCIDVVETIGTKLDDFESSIEFLQEIFEPFLIPGSNVTHHTQQA